MGLPRGGFPSPFQGGSSVLLEASMQIIIDKAKEICYLGDSIPYRIGLDHGALKDNGMMTLLRDGPAPVVGGV
jgi:hypothetical protein